MKENDYFFPLLLGVIATVLTFFLIKILFPHKSFFYELFFERSWIQYVTTLCFYIALFSILSKHKGFIHEKNAFKEIKKFTESLVGRKYRWYDVSSIISSFKGSFNTHIYNKYKKTISFTRIINALERLRNNHNPKDMEDYLKTRSEIDLTRLDTSYGYIKYLLWLIPTLGFIGTVGGIGKGIYGFSEAVQNAQNINKIKEHLPSVTNQLGTAFDTTLLALIFSIITVYYMSSVIGKQEDLLEEIDYFFVDKFCVLFEEEPLPTNQEIIDTISKKIDDIIRSENANYISLENLIEKKLISNLENLNIAKEILENLDNMKKILTKLNLKEILENLDNIREALTKLKEGES